jgi:hypothetical protein
MWGEVKVKVEVLFVDGAVESVVGNADGKIHKVDFLGALGDDPLKTVVRLPSCLEARLQTADEPSGKTISAIVQSL